MRGDSGRRREGHWKKVRGKTPPPLLLSISLELRKKLRIDRLATICPGLPPADARKTFPAEQSSEYEETFRVWPRGSKIDA